MSTTDPRADAKLQNLSEEMLQDLWRLRHPEEGGEKLTLEAICAALPRMVGFPVALSSLHGFYRWLEVKRRIDARADLVTQLKQDLAKDPEVSDEQIRKAGQRLFMAEGILEKDHKIFFDMVKIGQNEARLKQNDARIGLDKRKLAILEAKAAQADQAKAVLTQKISPEEQNRRLREILK